MGYEAKNITVLFVDDETNVLNSLRRGLMQEPYKIEFAENASKALEIFEKQKIGVIVTDMRMPGMDGLQLLKIIKEKYKNVVKIVLSGYTQLPQILATVNQVDIFKFITKPWKLDEEFKPIIQQAVDYHIFLQEREDELLAAENKSRMFMGVAKSYDEFSKDRQNHLAYLHKILTTTFKIFKTDFLNKSSTSELDKNSRLQMIDYIEALVTGYLNVQNNKDIDLNFDKFLDEMLFDIKNRKADVSVKLNKQVSANLIYTGKMNFIKLILTNFIVLTLDLIKSDFMKIDIVSENELSAIIFKLTLEYDSLTEIFSKDFSTILKHLNELLRILPIERNEESNKKATILNIKLLLKKYSLQDIT